MICLGIESTAHTFGVGILDEEVVLANVTSMYKPDSGGIHPRKAAEYHTKKCGEIMEKALNEADIEKEEIDLVAFSQGPGMPPCLRTGAVFARSLALSLDVPLVGVNHCIAHIEIGRMKTGTEDPITLYVSGGNTQIIGYSEGKYRVFGEVLDTAIGNALDKFAREIGIGHPGGPEIERLASKGEEYIELPYTIKGMDLSFSGLATEAERLVKEGEEKEDVCYSLQETMFAMLTEAVERAMAHADKDEVLLTGGVAANRRLQEMLGTMCEERDAVFSKVPQKLAGDNGAMIAWAGIIKYRSSGGDEVAETGFIQNWRTDQVEANWR
ncbi:MAG: bifunctional N(6)-L-threonylcarbamoyladenine synthase/serine/threonine protein kinase [Candidatus Aenigmatarchaeota archaeon]